MQSCSLAGSLHDYASLHDSYARLARALSAPRIAPHVLAGSSDCPDTLAGSGSSPAMRQAAIDLRHAFSLLAAEARPGQVAGEFQQCASRRHRELAMAIAALAPGDWAQRRRMLTILQALQVACAARQPARIPRLVHLLKTDPDPERIHLVNYLAIKSIIRHCPDYRILLHTPQRPRGPLWERLLPALEVHLSIPPQTLGNQRLQLAAHQADVWRVALLIQYGGFYFDWDLILLASPGPLRDQVCVMAMEPVVPGYKEVLGVSAIGAQPQSVFLRLWLEQMPAAFDPRDYVAHSTLLARDLAMQFPAGVRVLPSDRFYQPGWTAEAMAWLFDPHRLVDETERAAAMRNAIGIHLFESHENFLNAAGHLTLERLKTEHTNFSALVMPLLEDE